MQLYFSSHKQLIITFLEKMQLNRKYFIIVVLITILIFFMQISIINFPSNVMEIAKEMEGEVNTSDTSERIQSEQNANKPSEVTTAASSSINQTASKFTSQSSGTSDYVIKTPGCAIPTFALVNDEIQKYFYVEKPVVCNKGTPPLFESNLTSIYINPEALPHYNITMNNLQCCLTYFRRQIPNAKMGERDISVTFSNACKPFEGAVNINDNEDYAKMNCTTKTDMRKVIYQDYFHFIPRNSTNYHAPKEEKQPQDKKTNGILIKEKLNVLIVGIDGVSRLNLHRQMPNTVEQLRKMDAIEMLGYNKIADNSFPNLIALHTGHPEVELQSNCLPDKNAYFDDCEYIWDKFRANNYTIGFGEDTSNIGMFVYLRKGFKKQPFDYFYNYYELAAATAIGNNPISLYYYCMGARLTYKVLLQYTLNYVKVMSQMQRKYFGFFWTSSMSHDYINKPQLMDNDFTKYLSHVEQTGTLNNTVLIVMSDHGMRFGYFRNTFQGLMEDRLPFMFVVVPKWFKEKYSKLYNSLYTNSYRLITLYDLHETLRDLAQDNSPYNNTFVGGRPRGISLFQTIPDDRTCEQAEIDAQWCTCRESNKLPLNDTRIVAAVKFTINEHLNVLLKDYKNCSSLTLDHILDGRDFVENKETKKTPQDIQDYRVTFKTKPSGGIFEATVRVVGGKLEIVGTVGRLNTYGSQSKCIDNAYAKLFCYCKS